MKNWAHSVIISKLPTVAHVLIIPFWASHPLRQQPLSNMWAIQTRLLHQNLHCWTKGWMELRADLWRSYSSQIVLWHHFTDNSHFRILSEWGYAWEESKCSTFHIIWTHIEWDMLGQRESSSCFLLFGQWPFQILGRMVHNGKMVSQMACSKHCF